MDAASPSDLLRYYDWLQRRARSVASDGAAAEDLAQETFLMALLRPPQRGNLRGWLGAVLRNAGLQEARSQERRRMREREAARPEAVERPAEAEAVHELLTEVLAGLEPPFREALTLRYYEGLGIAEIAGRIGVPRDTIRSRLRRGLERMRRRLAARLSGPDRRLFAALAAPAAPAATGPGHGWAPLLPWVITAKWKPTAAVVALLLLGGLAPQLLPLGGERPTPAPPPPLADGPAAPPDDPGSAVGPAGREVPGAARSPLATAGAPAQPAPPEASPQTVLREALVLWADGTPAAGIEVAFEGSGGHARLSSGADGRVVLRLTEGGSGRLRCADERCAALLEGVLRPEHPAQPVLVVAPAVTLAGSVADTAGQAVEGAQLWLAPPDGYQRRFDRVLDGSSEVEFRCVSDAQGRFDLGSIPRLEGAELRVGCPGFEPHAESTPEVSTAEHRVELRHRIHAAGELLGRVLDAVGRPVAGARVSAAGEIARSDAFGEFAFSAEVRGRVDRLVALHPGHLPGERAADPGPDGPLWPDYVELRLGGPPLEIHGRVTDGGGEGLAGLRVWAADPTHFGVERDMPAQVEGLLGGAPTPAELEAAGRSTRDDPNAFWVWDRTDAEGRFRLTGLLDRPYRVKAMDMARLVHVEAEAIPAGSRDVELVLPAGQRFAGVVRSVDGTPVPGARVEFFHRAYRVEWGESMSTVWDVAGPGTQTADDGRFEAEGLPATAWISVSGEGIQRKAFFLEADDPREQLELEVELFDTGVAHLRVELADPAEADRFALLGTDGQAVEVALVRAGQRVTTRDPELVDGVSYVYSVREGRYELVLRKDGVEVRRRWVTLRPGDVQELRP